VKKQLSRRCVKGNLKGNTVPLLFNPVKKLLSVLPGHVPQTECDHKETTSRQKTGRIFEMRKSFLIPEGRENLILRQVEFRMNKSIQLLLCLLALNLQKRKDVNP